MSKRSQSLIAGGLTSSAGIFICKILGIVYIPFLASLAGSTATLNFYKQAYGYYEWIMLISLAGVPYAIATLVAKYHGTKDYKTMLLVRKIGMSVMLVLGFSAMILFMSLSGVIANLTTSIHTSPEDIQKTINVYIIVSLALFTVPLLSGQRGFFQGIKDFKTYAFSQVLEQVARVAFMIAMGSLAVYVFGYDGIWAVYFAVGSAAFSAVVAIVHLSFFHRDSVNEIKELAKSQEKPEVEKKMIIREFFYFSIPYLLFAFFGNSNLIAHNLFFERALDIRNVDVDLIHVLGSMVGTTTSKITSIPQVLAVGFSPAIIPFITEAFERKDLASLKKNIVDALQTVLYICAPVCFFILVIPTEIYYIMYGTDYVLGGEVLRWATLTAFFGTLSPVCNSLMMALRFRKQNLIILAIGYFLKLGIIVPFIAWFGYPGDFLSTTVVSVLVITLDLIIIWRHYRIDMKELLKNTSLMMIALVVAFLAVCLLQQTPLNVLNFKRSIGLLVLGVYGIVGLSIYFIITSYFKLPEKILGFRILDGFKRILGRFK